jgi:Sulfotransferase family
VVPVGAERALACDAPERSGLTAGRVGSVPNSRASGLPPFPFVVGCDRSGTTLVRAMLDSHPELAVPSESYFPAGLLRNRERFERGDGVDTDAILAELRTRERWQLWGLPEDEVRAVLSADEPCDVPTFIRSLYRAYALHAGKARYGDKTPKFVFSIDLFADAFPEAVFVHIVRDGRDVALSRRAAGWESRNIASEALRWCAHVEHGREHGRRLGPDRYLEVRYEDFVTEPEQHARTLCDFVSLGWSPAMLRYHERAGAIVSSVRHPELHENIARPPTPGLRTWSSEMSPAEIRAYDAAASRTLVAFGYPTGTKGIGAIERVRAAAARARWRLARSETRIRGDETGQ